MASDCQTLRPGLLVSLKTSITGNVSYFKRILDPEYTAADGSQRERWETERKIADAAEHKAAREAQQKASYEVRRVCVKSNFGLLCQEEKAAKLEEAIAKAREIVTEFNAKATISHLSVNVMKGRVAADDVEALKSINSEVRGLMEMMVAGLENADVKKIRSAASKARGIANMVTSDAAGRIKDAIAIARESAKRIVAAGEQSAIEIDRAAIKAIVANRAAFIDLDEVEAVAKPAAEVRGVDLVA